MYKFKIEFQKYFKLQNFTIIIYLKQNNPYYYLIETPQNSNMEMSLKESMLLKLNLNT